MKKFLSLVMAVMLLTALFAGCGNQSGTAQAPADGQETEQADQETAASENADLPEPSADGSGAVTDFLTACFEAKSVVLSRLSDGISHNPDAGAAIFSLMGIAIIDVASLPVSYFGMSQDAAAEGLSPIGATNVQCTQDGNNYTVSYSDEENNGYVYSGTYDPAAGALTCTGTMNGDEIVFMEYCKTVFGYAAQYYMINDDGTALVYTIAADGENGTIGISTVSEKPAALTGSVSADFPKTCDEWYSIYGTTITGKTSEGTELNFEYSPSEAN